MRKSLPSQMASEEIDWLNQFPLQKDPYTGLVAYTCATFVDGVAITPLGFDVTDEFAEVGE